MDIKIEIPKTEDIRDINKLAKQVQKLRVNWRPDLYLDLEQVIQIDELEKKIELKQIYIAKFNDEIIGYIMFDIIEKTNNIMRYRKQLNIDAICVDEKYRGKGIGTDLLNYTKEIAIENNCTDMYLAVNEENKRAIKCYEKFGFKVKQISYSMNL